MNRKGQFFSIAAALIVLIMVVLLGAQSTQVRGEGDLRVERASAHVMDGFVRNFVDGDVPHMLNRISRIALVTRSQQATIIPLDHEDFVEIMRTGSLDTQFVFRPEFGSDAHFERVLAALPFAAVEDMEFTYELLSVNQTSPHVFVLEFSFSYVLSANDMRWSDANVPLTVRVPTAGLRHPDYSTEIISELWDEVSGCLAERFFTPVDSCVGDLRPPGVDD